MPGFELEEDEYHLFFEDPKFNNLEVVMSPPASIAESIAFDKARAARDRATDLDDVEKAVQLLADMLGEHLISWNLEKHGLPVSCDAKGLMGSDSRIMAAIERAYVQAVIGVPAPLALTSDATGPSSNDGSTPEGALSIPMEPLSENP